jgi:hypothetical protein
MDKQKNVKAKRQAKGNSQLDQCKMILNQGNDNT